MKTDELELRFFRNLLFALLSVLVCARCGSSAPGSSARLLLACSRTDGNSCYETYGDSGVSGFTGTCVNGSETATTACATSGAFGKCVTPTVGGTYDVYYYYNFGFPQDCSDLGGTYTAIGDQHIVGAGAATYTEANEASNSVSTSPENTSYTLDATGIAISGVFEASSPTPDYFSFNSGSAVYAVTRIFVNGALASVSVGQKCTGYSDLADVELLGKVGIPTGLSCYVYVTPTAAVAGASFTIEMKSLP